MEGQENVINIKEIEDAIYKYPLSLLNIKDENILKVIDNYLPYSHGMEFECMQKNTYKQQYFDSIPNILAVNVDTSEQRFRIPNGLKGMICLYHICERMREYSIVDLDSSNHYHTDMTDVEDFTHNYDNIQFRKDNESWIIDELRLWKSYRTDNSAHLGAWFKYNDLGTLEIRIGEPTFDYEIIIKRLIQCGKIVTKLKKFILKTNHKLLNLEAQLKLLKEDVVIEETPEEEMERIINERNIQL